MPELMGLPELLLVLLTMDKLAKKLSCFLALFLGLASHSVEDSDTPQSERL
jgi:hypothetical protein